MQNRRRRAGRSRRGKILVMTALMVPVLFGAALVSTDTAVLCNAEAQLKTAADASALAAAMQLMVNTRITGTTSIATCMTNAQTVAARVASQNQVLGTGAVLSANAANAASGDVVIGYLSRTDTSSSAPSTTASASTYNAVQVTARRDASHGGQIPTFFGGPLGIGAKDLKVTSTAMGQNYAVVGYRSVSGENVSLLPIVLDQDAYNAMMARRTGDVYSYNFPPADSVTAGPDGVPESLFYPVASGNPGNWGTINIGVTANSTTNLVSQILYGISPAQLATYPGGKIQLDPALSPPSITFSGSPGMSSGMKDALISRIGKTGYIGIFDQTGSNGNNSWFRVVAFATIRVMDVNFQANPKYVVVQPVFRTDPSAILGAAQPSLTNGGVVRVHLAR
jgi:Flp pilus assembly protein TadG